MLPSVERSGTWVSAKDGRRKLAVPRGKDLPCLATNLPAVVLIPWSPHSEIRHLSPRLESFYEEIGFSNFRKTRKKINLLKKKKKISHQEHSGDRPHRQMNESKERETKTAQRHEMNSKYLNWSIRSLGKQFCEKPLKPRTVFSIEVNDHLSGETRPRNGASWRGAVLCILEHASLSVHTSGWLLALCGNPDMLGSVVCTPGELTAWIPGPSSLDAELTSPPEDSKGDHYLKTLPA